MGYFSRKIDRGRARAQKRLLDRKKLPPSLTEWLMATPGPPPPARKFVRLSIDSTDPSSGHPQGILRATSAIEDDPRLSGFDRTKLKRAIRWFNRHLHAPKLWDRRAVFWFRLEATSFREQAWPIVRVLQICGHSVWMTTSTSPGWIIYQDDLQIAAVPGESLPLSAQELARME